MSKNILTTAALALLVSLTTGCGGGGSTTTSASDVTILSGKDALLIVKNSPTGVCETEELVQLFEDEGFYGVYTSETFNNVTCSIYGKTEDDDCFIEYYDGSDAGNVACVIGVDGMYGNVQNGEMAKQEDFKIKMRNSGISNLIQIAE